jgi:hypothetical protein
METKNLNLSKHFARDIKFIDALYELVMNAMDQSRQVNVDVISVGEDGRSIIIRDNGTGIQMENFIIGEKPRAGSKYSHHGVGMKQAIARCFCDNYLIQFTTKSGKFSFEERQSSIHVIFTPMEIAQNGMTITIRNIPGAIEIVRQVRLHFLDLFSNSDKHLLQTSKELDLYRWPATIGKDSKSRCSIYVDGVRKKTHQKMDYLFNFKGSLFANSITVEQAIGTGKWKIFRKAIERAKFSEYLPRTSTKQTSKNRGVISLHSNSDLQTTIDSIRSSMSINNAPLYTLSSNQAAHIQRARGNLEEQIRQLEEVSVSEIRHQGSLEKNTAIPFDADLDLVIYLNPPLDGAEDLKVILTRSLDLALFDAGSPDILTGLYRYDGQHYTVDLVIGNPERGDGPANVQTVLAAVGSNNYVFEVMRMIKYLFKRHLVPFKSFLIEKFVLEAFASGKRPLGTTKVLTLKQQLLKKSLARIESSDSHQSEDIRQSIASICALL